MNDETTLFYRYVMKKNLLVAKKRRVRVCVCVDVE
jgi:hypothetical protein